MAAGDTGQRPEDERGRFRPYRRFLAVLVLIGALGLSGMILRGIINTLDRLPTAQRMDRLEVVDVRALRACAADLDKLERRARREAAKALESDAAWTPIETALEVDRLKIVARCRLDEPGADPAMQKLARGAAALENVLRTYTLMFQRLENEGRPERRALEAAVRAVEPLED